MNAMFGSLFKQTWRQRLGSDDFESALAEIVAEAVQEIDRVASVRVTSPMSLAGSADGGEYQIFLYNLLPQLRDAEPDARAELIERFISSMTTRAGDPALRDLVPVLKSEGWVTEAREMATRQSRPDMVEANQMASMPFAADVHIVFAFDGASAMSFATRGALEELGVSANAELLEKAKGVLRERLPPLEVHRGPASCMVTCGGTFESSVILFEDVIKELSALFEGELIALIPARDVLLFTGSKTPGGLEEITGVATRIHGNGGNYLLSTQALALTPTGWKPLS